MKARNNKIWKTICYYDCVRSGVSKDLAIIAFQMALIRLCARRRVSLDFLEPRISTGEISLENLKKRQLKAVYRCRSSSDEENFRRSKLQKNS